MQNRARIVRGSCKILCRNIITNTLACRSIFSARAMQNAPQFTIQPHCKMRLSCKVRSHCKMPRNFILNLLATTAQISLNFTRCGINFVLKFYAAADIARCVHIAKHTAKRCFRKIRPHEIPHTKSLSRTLRPRYVSFWRATRPLTRQISRHERPQYFATSLQRAANFSLMYSLDAS